MRSLLNFWTSWLIFIKLGMTIMSLSSCYGCSRLLTPIITRHALKYHPILVEMNDINLKNVRNIGLRQYLIKSSNLLNIKICLKLVTWFTYSTQHNWKNSYFLSRTILHQTYLCKVQLQIRDICSCLHSSCILKHYMLVTLFLWFYN